MKYKFTRYTGNYVKGDKKIGLNKSGLIRLSSGFCRETNATSFNYAILFFDSSNNAIAIKFTNDKREEGVFAVTKDRSAATISAKSFMTMNKINLRSYFGRYMWRKEMISDVGEVFIIELGRK